MNQSTKLIQKFKQKSAEYHVLVKRKKSGKTNLKCRKILNYKMSSSKYQNNNNINYDNS